MTWEDVERGTRDRLVSLPVERSVEILLDPDLWFDVGPHLSCWEAEAIGRLLVANGADPDTVAKLIIEGHGEGDDVEDLHQVLADDDGA